MKYDIQFEFSIPGVPTSVVTRTVEAPTVEQAVALAKLEFMAVRVISVNPSGSNIDVIEPPTVKV